MLYCCIDSTLASKFFARQRCVSVARTTRKVKKGKSEKVKKLWFRVGILPDTRGRHVSVART